MFSKILNIMKIKKIPYRHSEGKKKRLPKEKQQSDFTVTENDGASFIEVFWVFFWSNVLFRILKICDRKSL